MSKTDPFSDTQNEMLLAAKGIGHSARIAIIPYLLRTNTCVIDDLTQELAHATISQHLRTLKDIGVIQGTVEDSRMSSCIDSARWAEIQPQFIELFNRFEAPPPDGWC